jgi:hypothetical protein
MSAGVSLGSNGQIVFPATQSASSNANTLDDYEEGTFTPSFGSATGSLTSYTSSGRYTKIGNQVSVFFCVRITTAGTAGGVGFIGNLPFTTAAAVAPMSRAAETLIRETWVTGVAYQGYLSESSVAGGIADFSNNAIAWVNNYGYEGTFVYQTST